MTDDNQSIMKDNIIEITHAAEAKIFDLILKNNLWKIFSDFLIIFSDICTDEQLASVNFKLKSQLYTRLFLSDEEDFHHFLRSLIF